MAPFAPGLAKRKRPSENEDDQVDLSGLSYLKPTGAGKQTLKPGEGDARAQKLPRHDSVASVAQALGFDDTSQLHADPMQSERIIQDIAAPYHIVGRFQNDSEIMKHGLSGNTAFEKVNMENIGFISGTSFTSEVGDKLYGFQLESDMRLLMLDRYGNSIDGKNRGKVSKARLEEFFRRVEERDKEILKAVKIYEEWRMLTPEEKATRLAKQQEHAKNTLKSLEMEEEDEIPGMFSCGTDDIVGRVREWTLKDNAQPFDNGPVNIAGSELLFLSDDDDCSVDRSRDDENDDTDDQNEPRVKDALDKARLHAQSSFFKKTERSARRYRFPSWARIVPVEHDCTGIRVSDFDKGISLAQIKTESGSDPRVVSLALADEYAHFSSAIVVDRIFGGMVQEVQFFPDVRQAVVVFVYPQDAKNFLMHINCAAEYSGHEYRRLQIEAAWYMGDAAAGILPSQSNLLSRVIAHGASRTIRILQINRLIPKDPLIATIRAALPDNHLIRAKLIKPKLRMHQNPLMSNSVVLEFASVIQAIDAKKKLDNGEIKDFIGHPTEFLRDASVIPKPPMPWCACKNCTKPRDPTDNLDAATEASWRSVGKSSSCKDILDTPAPDASSVAAASQISRRDSAYKPRKDAKKVGEASYRHDDVQRSRL